jgi:hypothetical protein
MEERIEVLESDLVYLYKKDIENRATITKILENNDKIIKTLVFRNQEIDKKLSLVVNFIEYLCNKNSDPEINLFLIKNAIDIYNCDRNLFCKMIAKKEDMTMRCVDVYKLLFFDISYEELDDILEDASKNTEMIERSKWYKLNFLFNLVLQGYSLSNDLSGFPHKYQSDENDEQKKLDNNKYRKMFLQKMYKLFNDTDISSCPSPYYNSKEHFFKNTIFKLCYNEAKNI